MEEEEEPGAPRLSRGQKKKLRQRRQAEAEATPTTSESGALSAGRAVRASSARAREDASSSDTPSEFSESEQGSEQGDAGGANHDSLRGWPTPQGPRPPGWPPSGAELLSAHLAASLPPLRGQTLRLATLSCPQPKDPLLWRIFPLIRTAIACADEDLGSQDIIRFVEGNLPAACKATVSSARLHSLVNLVLSKNVRKGRLLTRGKKYALPGAEDLTVFVPRLSCSQLASLWVAWCPETKRPRQAALCYRSHGGALWLSIRPSAKCHRPDGVEPVHVLDTDAWIGPGSSSSTYAGWWDGARRTSWSLIGPRELSQDEVFDIIGQCVQQSRSSNDSGGVCGEDATCDKSNSDTEGCSDSMSHESD
eukprot:TRINITY_DN26672_c0_g1_i2.p1 TRINITY_DN26672_c0_g1~~TRINITY_DN26672_c0_g1_i2.p1  ORF type:complete len:393 (-),score=30.43 TRINITY_DN26672_c0_g1_i2:84-1175(-)